MKCAYCGREAKGTKEHIISSRILDLFPECYLTFDEHWGQTRAPSKGHFTEQVEILHEKRITTSFVSESCMTLGNWNHEA